MSKLIGRLLVVLAFGWTGSASAGLGNPQPGSIQSGIGLVSGFECDAKKIEIAFDGGELRDVPYGSSRNDTIGICGDADNGFGLLWNYNLLGPGDHTVRAYADGVLIGTSSFTVTTLGAEFLTDLQSSRRIYGFPDLDHDVTLSWQQGNQNYLISDYVPSINSFDVAGVWENAFTRQLFSISVSPQNDYPENAAIVVVASETETSHGSLASGVMQKNIAVIFGLPQPWTGSNAVGEYRIEFTGPRTAIVELIGCSPFFDCQEDGLVIGATIEIYKFFPSEENAALPQSVLAADSNEAARLVEDSSEAGGLAEQFYDAYIKAAEELEYLIEEMDDRPLKEIYQD